MKAAVVGYSGAGKSTLAKRLGEYCVAEVLHIDSIRFAPGWVERPCDMVCQEVCAFMERADWVIDGNYRNIVWEARLDKADLILFLNFSRGRCLWQAFRRYLQYRNSSRDSVAPGCMEKLDWEFIKWILYEGRTSEVRRGYEEMCDRYSDKALVLRNPKEREAFFAGMM